MIARRKRLVGILFASGLAALVLAWILQVPQSTIFSDRAFNIFWFRDANGKYVFSETDPPTREGVVTYVGSIARLSNISGRTPWMSAYFERHHQSIMLDWQATTASSEPRSRWQRATDAENLKVRAAFLDHVIEHNPQLDATTASRMRSLADDSRTRDFLLPRGIASISLQAVGIAAWSAVFLYLFFHILRGWWRRGMSSRPIGFCCARCKYDLGGLELSELHHCPECGLTLPKPVVSSKAKT
ncbi:MAG: hypothetical protein KF745_03135 [Phycisphaeraceae bacterium]|nr:hypothetical protein [Phycisphaeraceae bacterium]